MKERNQVKGSHPQVRRQSSHVYDTKAAFPTSPPPVEPGIRYAATWTKRTVVPQATIQLYGPGPRTTPQSVRARRPHTPLPSRPIPTGHNRIKKLWTMVAGGAAWNQQYLQIVRERLHRMGIIRIFDRQHQSGKAWRWEATDSFPADDYRKEQRKLRERSRLRTGVVGSYRDLVAGTRTIRELKVHNTLYHNADGISGLQAEIAEGRAPP